MEFLLAEENDWFAPVPATSSSPGYLSRGTQSIFAIFAWSTAPSFTVSSIPCPARPADHPPTLLPCTFVHPRPLLNDSSSRRERLDRLYQLTEFDLIDEEGFSIADRKFLCEKVARKVDRNIRESVVLCFLQITLMRSQRPVYARRFLCSTVVSSLRGKCSLNHRAKRRVDGSLRNVEVDATLLAKLLGRRTRRNFFRSSSLRLSRTEVNVF